MRTEQYFFYCFARVCARLDFFVPFLSRKKGQEDSEAFFHLESSNKTGNLSYIILDSPLKYSNITRYEKRTNPLPSRSYRFYSTNP